MSGPTLVVPAYNEASRLDGGALVALCEQRPDLRLVLVNDGSTDGTLQRLQAIAGQVSPRAEVLSLPKNVGKAEAVRRGLLVALSGPSEVVGYFDADFSTPVPEILRLMAATEQPNVAVAMGSRVALLGSNIRRSPARHYLGRIFASLASLTLKLSVYDTQCGAKVFRCRAALAGALETPFLSRWAFDVELLGRLLIGSRSAAPVPAAEFLEVPLGRWDDVPGSKLRPLAMVGMLKELAIIQADLRRRRRATPGG